MLRHRRECMDFRAGRSCAAFFNNTESERRMKTDIAREPERFIDFDEVHRRTGLSRVTIWRKERAGDFPQRRLITANRVGWVESEVARWLESRPVGIGRRPPQPEGGRDAA